MAIPLEQQLADAQAALAVAEQALAVAKARVADEFIAAQAEEGRARQAIAAARSALDDAEEDCDRRRGLTLSRRNAPRVYHPDLLTDFARVVGVGWEDRKQIQPGNTSKDVYDQALFTYVKRQRAADPAVRQATGVFAAAEAASTAAWRRRSNVETTWSFQLAAAMRAQRAVRDIADKIAKRDEVKERRATATAAIVDATRARAVLAQIERGELDPRAVSAEVT